MESIKCTSCKISIVNLEGTSKFKCPKCSKEEIVRCPKCRELVVKYTCPSCGFEGPN